MVIGSRRRAARPTAKAAASRVSLRASWSTSTTWFGSASMLAAMKAVCAMSKPPSRASAPKPSPAANSSAAGTEKATRRPRARARHGKPVAGPGCTPLGSSAPLGPPPSVIAYSRVRALRRIARRHSEATAGAPGDAAAQRSAGMQIGAMLGWNLFFSQTLNGTGRQPVDGRREPYGVPLVTSIRADPCVARTSRAASRNPMNSVVVASKVGWLCRRSTPLPVPPCRRHQALPRVSLPGMALHTRLPRRQMEQAARAT